MEKGSVPSRESQLYPVIFQPATVGVPRIAPATGAKHTKTTGPGTVREGSKHIPQFNRPDIHWATNMKLPTRVAPNDSR